MWNWVLGLLVSALLQEEGLSDAEVTARIEAFDRTYAAQDKALPALSEYEILQAVASFEKIDHPSVARLLVALAKDDREMIRTAAIRFLGNQKSSPREAREVVLRVLGADQESERVLRAAIGAAGKLKIRLAVDPLGKLLTHRNDVVAFDALQNLAEIESLAALPHLLSFLDANDEDSMQPGSAPAHSGRDARQARGKDSSSLRRLHREDALTLAHAAIRKLTDTEIRSTEELREWMRQNRDKIQKDLAKR